MGLPPSTAKSGRPIWKIGLMTLKTSSTANVSRKRNSRSNWHTAMPVRNAPLILLLAAAPALAQVGFYKRSDPPAVAQQWGELCIQKGAAGTLKESLFGG
jgi:hypothetical protein